MRIIIPYKDIHFLEVSVSLRWLGLTKQNIKKRQICFSIDNKIINEMEKVKEETGLSLSKQLELRLKGFEITKKTHNLDNTNKDDSCKI